MIGDHERFDPFCKTLLEVLVLKPPFNYEMQAAENCSLLSFRRERAGITRNS